MAWYLREQRDLITTLSTVGPDAPTLCSGWRSRHLAAHLYLRLHRGGQLVRHRLRRGGADAFTVAYGDAHDQPESYERLLAQFRAAPSALNPMGWGGDNAHLLEYVVHHEDVRRAVDPDAPPRQLPPEMAEALWRRVRFFARLGSLRSRDGLVLVVPDGPRAVVRKAGRSTALVGDVTSLALHITGRTAHSGVRVIRPD